jgi:lipoate-protein ligase B
VIELGRVEYHQAHHLQRALADRLIQGEIGHDLLLLLEHEPTITLGRGTRPASLPLSAAELRRRGFTVAEVERGGDVTWHGPGQLVGYPIIDLNRHRPDLHWYLRKVEEAIIEGLARLGLEAGPRPGYTGVWIGDRKIASIGVHSRQWVTTHGFALNVTNDLAGFDCIVPCGLEGVRMTSVAECLPGGDPDALPRQAREALSRGFAGVFDLVPRVMGLEELGATTGQAVAR